MAEILDLTGGKAVPSKEELDMLNQMGNSHKVLTASDYPSEVCPKCGSKLFTTAFVIKDIPGIAVGALSQEAMPMPLEQYSVLVCAKCGELAPAMTRDEEARKMVEKLLDDNKAEAKEEK